MSILEVIHISQVNQSPEMLTPPTLEKFKFVGDPFSELISSIEKVTSLEVGGNVFFTIRCTLFLINEHP